MKKVWKCDFCYHIEVFKDDMVKHEEKCSSNPIFKKCWSCKHHTHSYDSYKCDKQEYCYDYEDDGNCPTWETDDEKLLRKIKLENLNNK